MWCTNAIVACRAGTSVIYKRSGQQQASTRFEGQQGSLSEVVQPETNVLRCSVCLGQRSARGREGFHVFRERFSQLPVPNCTKIGVGLQLA